MDADRPEVSQGPANRQKIILLVDPHRFTRECIVRVFESGSREFRVRGFASVRQMEPLPAEPPPLIVVNIHSDRIDAPAVVDELSVLERNFPDAAVAIVAEDESPDAVAEAMRRGMRAYLPTSMSPTVMLAALRLVLAGGVYAPPLTAPSEQRRPFGLVAGAEEIERLLTPREAQVLAKLREGKANKIIAFELRMALSTVKVHVRRIMRKLHATNRTQVASIAYEKAVKVRGGSDSVGSEADRESDPHAEVWGGIRQPDADGEVEDGHLAEERGHT